MLKEWEQQYYDYLPTHFNDLSFNETELNSSILNSSNSMQE